MKNLNIKEIHDIELDMLKELDRISKRYGINYYLAYGTAIGAVRHNGFIPWDTDVDVIVEFGDSIKLDRILNEELDSKYSVNGYRTDVTSPLMFSRIVLARDSGVTVHVDLFPMVGLPENKFKQLVFIKLSRIINALFFFKKVNPEKYYMDREKKKILSKVLKIFAKPFPNKLLIFMKNKLATKYSTQESNYLFNLCGAYGKKEIIPKTWLGEPVYKQFMDEKLPLPSEYDNYLKHIYGDYMTPKKDNYV